MALTDNLVSYWKLDESSGNAADSVGSNTLTNNNSVTYGAGKINNGINLASASSQYLRNASVSGYPSWSVSFWFKPTTNQDQIPVTLDDVGSNRIFQFFFNATQVNVSGWTSGGTQKSTSLTNHGMSTGTWYFWTATWDSAGNLTLYKNGSSIASVATTGNNKATSSTFNLGRAEDSSYYTNGSLDEVGIWSRALTADEVSQLYNSNRALAYPLTAPTLYGGVASYKFDNGAITTDSIGAYTLTNNNTVAGASTGIIGYCADAGTSNTNKTLSRDDTYGMLGSTAKTYSFWAKINTAPSSGVQQVLFRHLFGGSAVGNYANVAYYNNSGTYQVRMPTSPGGMIVNQTLTVGTWYHFVVTVPASNTGNITCYMNGSLLGTTANWSQNYALTTRLAIFGDHALADPASAMCDEFSVFNRALTSTEVSELYASGAGKQYPWNAISFVIAEVIALSETLTSLRTRLFSIAETSTLSETRSILKGVIFTISESLGLSETMTILRSRLFTIAENMGLVEVLAEIRKKWSNDSKHNATFTNETKHTVSFSDQSKHDSDWTNESKS